jgi:hypothetical protein
MVRDARAKAVVERVLLRCCHVRRTCYRQDRASRSGKPTLRRTTLALTAGLPFFVVALGCCGARAVHRDHVPIGKGRAATRAAAGCDAD